MTYSVLPAMAIVALVSHSATPLSHNPLFPPTPSVQVAPTCAEWGTDEFVKAYSSNWSRNWERWLECIRIGADPNISIPLKNNVTVPLSYLVAYSALGFPESANLFSALIEAGADVNVEVPCLGVLVCNRHYSCSRFRRQVYRPLPMTSTVVLQRIRRQVRHLVLWT